MTVAREAIGLPVLFLSVVLLGGVRLADGLVLLPPSVFTLVLGVLLVRVLVQCGAFAPERLLAPARSTLANLSGVVVLAALWAAGAQTMALLIPEWGLPRVQPADETGVDDGNREAEGTRRIFAHSR